MQIFSSQFVFMNIPGKEMNLATNMQETKGSAIRSAVGIGLPPPWLL